MADGNRDKMMFLAEKYLKWKREQDLYRQIKFTCLTMAWRQL
jgi:hypothetical protein